MEDISDEKYTYDAGIPWPERAEKRIAELEREKIVFKAAWDALAAQHATMIDAHNSLVVSHNTLADAVRGLNALVHRLLNAGAEEAE